MTILLIDGDESVSEQIGRLLDRGRLRGCQFRSEKLLSLAAGGFARSMPDCVLLWMEGCTEADLNKIGAVRRVMPGSAVITLSELTSEDGSAIQRGAQDCLQWSGLESEPLARAIIHAVERQRTIRELTRHGEVLSLQMERMPIGCILFDPSLRVLDINPAAERLFGYSKQELLGRDVRPFIVSPEVRPLIEPIVERLVRGDMTAHSTNPNMTRDGRVIICDWTNTPLKDESGLVFGMLCMVQEVTERQRAADALRDSEQRYRRLFEASMDAIVVLDESGRFLSANPAASRLFGIDRSEMLSMKAEAIRTPPEQESIFTSFARCKSQGWVSGELEFFRPSGDKRVAEFILTPVEDRRFLCILRDVTEKRAAERALRESEDHLRHAQKLEAVGMLASGVAHDFNNLLTAIRGFASLARTTLKEGHAAIEALDHVEEAGRQAAGVASALLTFAKKSPTTKVPVLIGPLIDAAVRLFRRSLPPTIKLFVDTASVSNTWVEGDGVQLQQVVMNLALNARDAIQGNGSITITAFHPASQGPPKVCIEVRDTGAGIAPEIKPRIFEPFFTTKLRGQGTGLGLAVIHGIVSEHAGRIDVQTALGEGSTFTVTLPTVPPPGGVAHSIPIVESRKISAGQRVLIAEHNQLIRGLVGSMLSTLGYEVVQSTNGREALRAINEARTPFDLIVADASLPNPDGRSLARHLRAHGDHTRVVIISGRVEEDGQAAEDPRTVTLHKPFQLSDLQRVISLLPSSGDLSHRGSEGG